MTRDDVARIVDEVLMQILGVPSDAVATLTRDGSEAWTSLAQVEIFFSLEEELGIKLSDDDMAFAESRDDLIEFSVDRLGL